MRREMKVNKNKQKTKTKRDIVVGSREFPLPRRVHQHRAASFLFGRRDRFVLLVGLFCCFFLFFFFFGEGNLILVSLTLT